MRWLGTVGRVLVVGLSALYIANPSWGVFEVLPDNLPGVGNLDEAAATAALLWAVRGLRRKRALPKDGSPEGGSRS